MNSNAKIRRSFEYVCVIYYIVMHRHFSPIDIVLKLGMIW